MANYFESGMGKATLHHQSEDHVAIGSRAALEALSQIKQFQPCLEMAFVSIELGTRYANEFGKHSVSIGLFYSLYQILWEAIETAGSLDSAKIKEAVLKHEFKGTVLGDIKYNPENNTAVHLLRAFQWNKGYQEVAFPSIEGGWKVQPVKPWNKR